MHQGKLGSGVDASVWRQLLAVYRTAEAALLECARRTAGTTLASAGSWATLDAVEEEFGGGSTRFMRRFDWLGVE